MADSNKQTSVATDPVRQLADRVIAGDMPALARTISLIEAGHKAAQPVLRHLRANAGHALVVGFTGPPGAGKSTLINAYIAALRGQGKRVAVLAVDPSSPLTGGAVLGDVFGRATPAEGAERVRAYLAVASLVGSGSDSPSLGATGSNTKSSS